MSLKSRTRARSRREDSRGRSKEGRSRRESRGRESSRGRDRRAAKARSEEAKLRAYERLLAMGERLL